MILAEWLQCEGCGQQILHLPDMHRSYRICPRCGSRIDLQENVLTLPRVPASR